MLSIHNLVKRNKQVASELYTGNGVGEKSWTLENRNKEENTVKENGVTSVFCNSYLIYCLLVFLVLF